MLQVNVQDANGYSGLMWAAQNGHSAVMKALLESRAEVARVRARVSVRATDKVELGLGLV